MISDPSTSSVFLLKSDNLYKDLAECATDLNLLAQQATLYLINLFVNNLTS